MVLGFVARRLYAEQVVMLFAVRESAGELPALAGLPELVLGGLDDQTALELLSSLAPGRLSPAVAARIIAETGGNPLALVEVARELSPAQLAGAELLPEPLPTGGSLEQAFSRRVSRLPPETRLLLAVAAAEPGASQAVVWRTAEQLGIDPEAAALADLGGLAVIGSQVEFRHPLVRSAAYYAIPLRQRRQMPARRWRQLVTEKQPDRVAWHLGMAALDVTDLEKIPLISQKSFPYGTISGNSARLFAEDTCVAGETNILAHERGLDRNSLSIPLGSGEPETCFCLKGR